METKPWYLSKTIISSIVGSVFTLLLIMGIVLPDTITSDVFAQQVTDVIAGIGTLVSTIIAIYGRVTATKQIGNPE
jgi:protein-S-isoprenylcysteine O-methyltransferase Ste14